MYSKMYLLNINQTVYPIIIKCLLKLQLFESKVSATFITHKQTTIVQMQSKIETDAIP